jgi:hypothetical protein
VSVLDVRLDLPQAFSIHIDDQHRAGAGGMDFCDGLADPRSASGDDGSLPSSLIAWFATFPSLPSTEWHQHERVDQAVPALS